MKHILAALLSFAMLFAANAADAHRSKGGHYAGGIGRSHKGGHYIGPDGSSGHSHRKIGKRSGRDAYVSPDERTGLSDDHEIALPAEHKSLTKHHSVRSHWARDEFEREHPCPENGAATGSCPHHVIDHVKPLACGGPDRPSNMQWQTTEEGKAKDRWERSGCEK
jgi:hypothetical protein